MSCTAMSICLDCPDISIFEIWTNWLYIENMIVSEGFSNLLCEAGGILEGDEDMVPW